MKCAMLELSEVATVILRVGADAHAFGLDADRNLGHDVAALAVDDGDERVVLVGDVDALALGIDVHQLGVGTGLEMARHFELRRCR